MKDVAVSAMTFICVAISGPLALLCLKLTEEHLGNYQFQEKFGALYKGFALDSPFRYSFNIVYLVRRFFYAFTIVTLKHSAVFQGLFQLLMSQLVTYYILAYRPYLDPLDNWVELANEFTITAVFLLNQGYLQTSASMSRRQQEDYGLAYIAVIAASLLINAYFFCKNIVQNLVMAKLVPLIVRLKEKVFPKK